MLDQSGIKKLRIKQFGVKYDRGLYPTVREQLKKKRRYDILIQLMLIPYFAFSILPKEKPS